MSQLGGYAQILGHIVYEGVLIVFILQLQIFRKNMFGRSMQQAYSNTSQVLYNNEFTNIESRNDVSG
jgi:hypothetical protein